MTLKNTKNIGYFGHPFRVFMVSELFTANDLVKSGIHTTFYSPNAHSLPTRCLLLTSKELIPFSKSSITFERADRSLGIFVA